MQRGRKLVAARPAAPRAGSAGCPRAGAGLHGTPPEQWPAHRRCAWSRQTRWCCPEPRSSPPGRPPPQHAGSSGRAGTCASRWWTPARQGLQSVWVLGWVLAAAAGSGLCSLCAAGEGLWEAHGWPPCTLCVKQRLCSGAAVDELQPPACSCRVQTQYTAAAGTSQSCRGRDTN